MAGFHTIEAVRPSSPNRPKMPVVDRRLIEGRKQAPPPRTPSIFITAKQRGEIRRMRAEGVSRRQVAARLGVTESAVQRHARDVPPPPGGWAVGRHEPTLNHDKILRMRRAGFSLREIAQDVGCSQAAVFYVTTPRKTRKRKKIDKEIASLISVVASQTRVGVKAIKNAKREPSLAKARAIIFWWARTVLKKPFLKIAHFCGGFDHTTVIYAVRRVNAIIAALGLEVCPDLKTMTRRLWNAEWPATGSLKMRAGA